MKKQLLLAVVLLLLLPLTAFAGTEGGFEPASQGTFPSSETIEAYGTSTSDGANNITSSASMSVSGTVTHQSKAIMPDPLALSTTAALGPNVPPAFSSATIGTNGITWTIILTEPVEFGAGGNGGWTVATSATGVITLTYTSGSGTNTLIYTGNKSVGITETIASGLNYTQPGNGIQDPNGLDLPTSGPFAVANNSLVSKALLSAKGLASTSPFGSTYVNPLTLEAASGVGAAQGNALACYVTLEAGATSGGESLSLSYPSLAFQGWTSASAGGLFKPYPTVSLDASGALTGDSLGNLSSSVTVTGVAVAGGDVVSPTGGFDIGVVATFRPPVTLPVGGGVGDEAGGNLSSGETITAAAGFSTSMPGAMVFNDSVTFSTGGGQAQTSSGIFYSSLTYLVGDYYQGPQQPTYYDSPSYGVSSAFSMVAGGTHNVTPFAPFSNIARSTASSKATVNSDETLSGEAASSGSSQETSYPSVTADVGGAIAAESTIVPTTSVPLSASAGAATDHYLTQPETVAFGAGAAQTQESYSMQPETVALGVGASQTQVGQLPYELSSFSASADFDAIVSGGLHYSGDNIFSGGASFDTSVTGSVPAGEITASSIASIQAESQYTIPDQRRVESVHAGIGASSTREAISDSTTFTGLAAIQAVGSTVYNETIAMTVGGASSLLSRAVQGRTVTIAVVARENSLSSIPIPNAVFFGSQ